MNAPLILVVTLIAVPCFFFLIGIYFIVGESLEAKFEQIKQNLFYKKTRMAQMKQHLQTENERMRVDAKS